MKFLFSVIFFFVLGGYNSYSQNDSSMHMHHDMDEYE